MFKDCTICMSADEHRAHIAFRRAKATRRNIKAELDEASVKADEALTAWMEFSLRRKAKS